MCVNSNDITFLCVYCCCFYENFFCSTGCVFLLLLGNSCVTRGRHAHSLRSQIVRISNIPQNCVFSRCLHYGLVGYLKSVYLDNSSSIRQEYMRVRTCAKCICMRNENKEREREIDGERHRKSK